MSDKERIKRLIETLMRVKNIVGSIKTMSIQDKVQESCDELTETIEFVIQANADQIETPQ